MRVCKKNTHIEAGAASSLRVIHAVVRLHLCLLITLWMLLLKKNLPLTYTIRDDLGVHLSVISSSNTSGWQSGIKCRAAALWITKRGPLKPTKSVPFNATDTRDLTGIALPWIKGLLQTTIPSILEVPFAWNMPGTNHSRQSPPCCLKRTVIKPVSNRYKPNISTFDLEVELE